MGGQHGRRFVFLRHTHRPQRRPYPFIQAGEETLDTNWQQLQQLAGEAPVSGDSAKEKSGRFFIVLKIKLL